MAVTNNMTALLNRIEREIGTSKLNLPEDLRKDKWNTIIEEHTLVTFSNYFPHMVKVEVERSDMKDGLYVIDETKIPGIGSEVKILGIRDFSFRSMYPNSATYASQAYGSVDAFSGFGYDLEQAFLMQAAADQASFFNIGLYVEFFPPNMVSLRSSTEQDYGKFFGRVVFDVHVMHTPNLNTIEPTKMELFRELAKADICDWLYNQLKLFDDLETVFGTVNMKLDDIRDIGKSRDQLMDKIETNYVSAANKYQPIVYVV
jgi:hypothetical protein